MALAVGSLALAGCERADRKMEERIAAAEAAAAAEKRAAAAEAAPDRFHPSRLAP
jgi:hypothetical protein